MRDTTEHNDREQRCDSTLACLPTWHYWTWRHFIVSQWAPICYTRQCMGRRGTPYPSFPCTHSRRLLPNTSPLDVCKEFLRYRSNTLLVFVSWQSRDIQICSPLKFGCVTRQDLIFSHTNVHVIRFWKPSIDEGELVKLHVHITCARLIEWGVPNTQFDQRTTLYF